MKGLRPRPRESSLSNGIRTYAACIGAYETYGMYGSIRHGHALVPRNQVCGNRLELMGTYGSVLGMHRIWSIPAGHIFIYIYIYIVLLFFLFFMLLSCCQPQSVDALFEQQSCASRWPPFIIFFKENMPSELHGEVASKTVCLSQRVSLEWLVCQYGICVWQGE